jgi:hypothetical protein
MLEKTIIYFWPLAISSAVGPSSAVVSELDVLQVPSQGTRQIDHLGTTIASSSAHEHRHRQGNTKGKTQANMQEGTQKAQ